jgi:tetratricopeptide (TPR) repeat protein
MTDAAPPTTTVARPVVHRPQPVGAFPLPAGYLLVPAGADTEDARLALLAGRVPDPWPARMRAHELALAGDRDGALAALGDAGDAVSRFNRFVLDPDGADTAALRAELGDLAPLVDVVAFVLGHSDTPPERDGTDGEVAALVLSAQAADAIARGATHTARELLDGAAELVAGTPLAGLMLGAAASVCLDGDDHDGGRVRLERAVKALDGADALRTARAELHLALAGALHAQGRERPDLLAKAIPHYHSALQLVLRAEAPEVWAAAHADLAAAYLTMPMSEASDQLRLGVAVSSLRSALKVYTPQTHPERWASTQLNLANSLVYTPSQHQADNLVEAVELYEAVLEVRGRESDPLGRARVLANQGNVLAHLGMFDPAKAKLYEARFIFEEFGDHDSMRSVRGVLDEVARQQTLIKTGDRG